MYVPQYHDIISINILPVGIFNWTCGAYTVCVSNPLNWQHDVLRSLQIGHRVTGHNVPCHEIVLQVSWQQVMVMVCPMASLAPPFRPTPHRHLGKSALGSRWPISIPFYRVKMGRMDASGGLPKYIPIMQTTIMQTIICAPWCLDSQEPLCLRQPLWRAILEMTAHRSGAFGCSLLKGLSRGHESRVPGA